MSAGKTYTIYCLSTLVDRPLGEVWSAKRVDGAGALSAVLPLDVRVDAAGGWVVLRLRPADWPGPMAFQGRFADGALTELVLTTLHAGGLPVLKQFAAEPVASLAVTVVGAAEPSAPLWVRARVLGLPLDEVAQQPVRDGVASFANLATSRDGLEVALGDDPDAPTYRLKTEAWSRAGEVRVHAPLPGRLPVRLPAPPASRTCACRSGPRTRRPTAGCRRRCGCGIRLDLAPGRWRALVETQGGFAATASAWIRTGPSPTSKSAPWKRPQPCAGPCPRPQGDDSSLGSVKRTGAGCSGTASSCGFPSPWA